MADPTAALHVVTSPRCFGWTGCPAEESCWHYRTGDRKPRPTALCKACSRAAADIMALHRDAWQSAYGALVEDDG